VSDVAIAALDELRAPGRIEARRPQGDHRDGDGGGPVGETERYAEALLGSLASADESRLLPVRTARARAENLVALTVIVGVQLAWLSALAFLAVRLVP
jgi:hypothetical protein